MSEQQSIKKGRVILAPMEGVLDPPLREILTAVNQYDLCVTEFVRVVDQLLTKKTLLRLCPELEQGGKTRSGTPVRVQLLGQHPQWLAENAILATEMGSPGIDINFGCPAKRVNQSCGGAALLKEPETIYQILVITSYSIHYTKLYESTERILPALYFTIATFILFQCIRVTS